MLSYDVMVQKSGKEWLLDYIMTYDQVCTASILSHTFILGFKIPDDLQQPLN